MYIVVYNKKAIDSDKAFKKVRDEVLKPLHDCIKIPREGNIVVIDPSIIQIDFRHGETRKLSGLFANYHITEPYYTDEYFDRQRFGKRLNSLDDIFDIVIEHIKSLMVNKESED